MIDGGGPPQRFFVRPGRPLRGTVRVPGDKSIGHRALIFAALAEGRSTITGLSGESGAGSPDSTVPSTSICALAGHAPSSSRTVWPAATACDAAGSDSS